MAFVSRFGLMGIISIFSYAKYQCVMFVKRRDGVVEINTGGGNHRVSEHSLTSGVPFCNAH